MALLQSLGFGSFILVSFVLAIRLLLLWRRTGEIAELAIGTSFLTGGGLGYGMWFVFTLAARQETAPETLHTLASIALGLTCLGALVNAAGVWRIFRAEDLRAALLVGTFTVLCLAGWLSYVVAPVGETLPRFYATLLTAGATYLWTTAECIRLHVVLAKRARIGLVSPHLADRARLWAIAYAAVTVMIGSSFVAYLVLGPNVASPAVSSFQSLCGLVCAAHVWLGFFPPEFYLRRFESGAEA